MSKYLEFKEVPFKGKTKRFEVVSKNSFVECGNCGGNGHHGVNSNFQDCVECNGTGDLNDILGRIQWHPQWRQYTFHPSYPTVWNRDCLDTIIKFINDLMNERANQYSNDLYKKERACTCTTSGKGICDTCKNFSEKYKNENS